MPKVILHVLNEDPVVGEIESVPSSNDTIITVKHPMRRDGKDISYLEPTVSVVCWPMHRVMYIEILPSGEEEDIITFIRE